MAIEVSRKKRDSGVDIDALIGLWSIKRELRRIEAMLWLNRHREKEDLGRLQLESFHFAFRGNPGTGKTTVARLLGEIFRRYGILRVGDVVEVDRAKLVGSTPGETETLTRKILKSALDGVLFIDEAYTLIGEGPSDPGQRALEVILKGMEDYRDALVVVFAGYPAELERFFEKVTGLKSRVPYHLEFEDYTPLELVRIANFMAAGENLEFSDEASQKLLRIMENRIKAPDFSNAREVRNILDHAKTKMSSRLQSKRKVLPWDLKTITAVDVEDPTGGDDAMEEEIERRKKELYTDPSDRSRRYVLARTYAASGLWSDAAAALEPLAGGLDDREAALYGKALYMTGEREKAWQVFSGRVQNRDSLFSQGLSALWAGEILEAESFLEKAVYEDPSNAERHYALAFAAFSAGKWREAVEELREGLEKKGSEVPPSILRNLPFERLEAPESREAFRDIMTRSWGQGAETMLALGKALLSSGDEKALPYALEVLKSVLASRPDDAAAHRLLAVCQEASGDAASATASLEVALELEPRRTEDWYKLAKLYNQVGMNEKAEEIYWTLVDDPSGTGSAALSLAQKYEERGNLEEAERLYEKAWSQGLEEDEKILCAERVGTLKASSGRLDDGLRFFEGAGGETRSPEARFWHGRALVEKGKWPEAERLFHDPLPEKGLKNAARYWRIRVFIAMKNLYQARKHVTGDTGNTWLKLVESAALGLSGDRSAIPDLRSVPPENLGPDGLGLLAAGLAGVGEWELAENCARRARTSDPGPILWERANRRVVEETAYLGAVAAAHLGKWADALEEFRKVHVSLMHPAPLYGQAVSFVALGEVTEARKLSLQLKSGAPASARKLEELIRHHTGFRKILADKVDPDLLETFVFV
ncbi:MAG: tetratricopeptide repeat protein [Thermovirgaceae bacterium]